MGVFTGGMTRRGWLQSPAYTKFMLRELTSVFMALYCVFLLVLLYRALNMSADEFRAYVESSLQSPVNIILHLVALAFAVYCSITFFNATPRAIVVRRGEDKVPDAMIAGGHYAAWAVVSLVVILIALRA